MSVEEYLLFCLGRGRSKDDYHVLTAHPSHIKMHQWDLMSKPPATTFEQI